MQMRFGVQDGQAFRQRSDELCAEFAEWTTRQSVAGDAGDVELLLEWKWAHGDGRLDHWTAADAEEFVLEWCPAELTSPLDLCRGIPTSTAAFVAFLAHRGLLAPGCSPSSVRRRCEKVSARFLREMADRAVAADAELAELARRTGRTAEELSAMLASDESRMVGPVRLPTSDEVAEAVRRAPVFAEVNALVAACAAPGVTVSPAGDEPPSGHTWVDVAMTAGALRRQGQRLVSTGEFEVLPAVDAYGRVVRAALEVGLRGASAAPHPEIGELVDESAIQVLAGLLDADTAVPTSALVEMVSDAAGVVFAPEVAAWAGDQVPAQLRRMVELGLLASDPPEDTVRLTAAGVAVGVELVQDYGMDVVERADPATATAAELFACLWLLDADEAVADLTTWSSTRPDAAAELVATALAEDQEDGDILALLELVTGTLGEPAVDAVRHHLSGPHSGLVTAWLVTRNAIDPGEIDLVQLMTGLVAISAVLLDDEGPAALVDFFGDHTQAVELIEHLWMAEHDRTGDVLAAIGAEHPDATIAAAARKALGTPSPGS